MASGTRAASSSQPLPLLCGPRLASDRGRKQLDEERGHKVWCASSLRHAVFHLDEVRCQVNPASGTYGLVTLSGQCQAERPVC